ncbi:MAG: cytochrome c biogenesis protein DipZ [Acidimicrobiales bacterium]|jgi:cytochrome c biogenesis protein CcdA/thiol-disulfide isomerase/thioredoxin
MLALLVIGFIAGLITGISPCILPVLPVVLFAGMAPVAPDAGRRRSWRPVSVVAGLVLSFATFTLAGSALLSALDLPQDLLWDAGLVVLGLVGLGLAVPALGRLIERPFTHLPARPPRGTTSGFILGIGLGPLFVPCAGPVLAAIAAVAATRHFGPGVVGLTLAFSLGSAAPLLVVAVAGDKTVERVRVLRKGARTIRTVGGVVLVGMCFALAFSNIAENLQKLVPGYTNALTNDVENSTYVRNQLAALRGEPGGNLGDCVSGAPALARCGAAPAFAGITTWLNTPHDAPLSLAGLRGNVVLVDFWTYSCINCQRELPHVERWYERYRRDGLVVIGVHTPEFAFEHVEGNVAAAARMLDVRFPIAIDNHYATWDAYRNSYWPAEYLIDARGELRYVAFGEGNYARTETFIRNLLVEANPVLRLPARTDVPDRTPTAPLTPETYLGYDYLGGSFQDNLIGETPGLKVATRYAFPSYEYSYGFELAGTWTVNPEEMTAGTEAELRLKFEANDVYLVLGGRGTVEVRVNGALTKTISVHGIPRLYTLVSERTFEAASLLISVSPGVRAYDFTFG